MAARWGDYDGTFLAISGEDRKGGVKAMLYRLEAEVVSAVEDIREPGRSLIWPWGNKCFWYHYRTRILDPSGLEYVPWRTGPQKMRRSK